MADKETLAAKFRAAAQRAEAEAKKKQEEVERVAKARDLLFADLAGFCEAVGLVQCAPSEAGVKLARGDKSIRFDRGEGNDVVVRLSDRDLIARFVGDAWWLGDGPTAKPLWDDGLVWMLVNWLDLPNPSAPEEPVAEAAAPEVLTTAPKPAAPKATSGKEGAPSDPTTSRRSGQTFPGSRLQELKNPWD